MKKSFSLVILIDQVPLSGYLYFVRYLLIYVLQLLLNQVLNKNSEVTFISQIKSFSLHDLKSWQKFKHLHWRAFSEASNIICFGRWEPDLNSKQGFSFCILLVYFCKFLGSQSKGYLNHELKILQCFCTLIIRD